jgi:hypothetical protein
MKCFLFVAAALLALASAVPAQAAPVPLTINYTLPTVACSTVNGTPVVPCDNVPLTGANALTAVDVWIAKAPIADTDTSAPTLSLAANVTTGTSTFAASDGDTLYVRLKARTANGSSVFSNQGTKLVTVKVIPNAPIVVTINIG